MFVINTIKSSNTVTGKLIADYISNHVIEIKQAMQSVINSISESDTQRSLTYKYINPNLIVHDLYKVKHNVSECHVLY